MEVKGLLPKATGCLFILHTMFVFVLYIFVFPHICHMPTFNSLVVLSFFFPLHFFGGFSDELTNVGHLDVYSD